jgi:hypothetical protein
MGAGLSTTLHVPLFRVFRRIIDGGNFLALHSKILFHELHGELHSSPFSSRQEMPRAAAKTPATTPSRDAPTTPAKDNGKQQLMTPEQGTKRTGPTSSPQSARTVAEPASPPNGGNIFGEFMGWKITVITEQLPLSALAMDEQIVQLHRMALVKHGHNDKAAFLVPEDAERSLDDMLRTFYHLNPQAMRADKLKVAAMVGGGGSSSGSGSSAQLAITQ